MKCKKLVKRGIMTHATQCVRKLNHLGTCSPDLTNMRFGNLTVLSLVKRKKRKKTDHCTSLLWNVIDWLGCTRQTTSGELTSGGSAGKHAPTGLGYSCTPEYSTVTNHYGYIFKIRKGNIHYADMPFYDEWNPKKGGSFLKGAKWIVDNLGKKPSPNWSIDIIDHGKGFVPGNLRWALRKQQLLNQKHRRLGQFSDEEFAVEAFRRGYVKAEKAIAA